MSSWTAWSSCSVSCGLGSLFRQRDILREAVPGGSCGGAQFDSRACFPRACPGGLNEYFKNIKFCGFIVRSASFVKRFLTQLTVTGQRGRSGQSVTLPAEAESGRGTEPVLLLPPKTAGGNARARCCRLKAATLSRAPKMLAQTLVKLPVRHSNLIAVENLCCSGISLHVYVQAAWMEWCWSHRQTVRLEKWNFVLQHAHTWASPATAL